MRVKVREIYTAPQGALLKLSAKQAEVRAHNLKAKNKAKDGSGVFAVIEPVQFKVGEEFEIVSKVDKVSTMFLEDLDAKEKKSAPAKGVKAPATPTPNQGGGENAGG